MVSFDEFRRLDHQGRLRVFNEIAPEERAELVRAQIRRWIDANAHRLSPEQLAVMEENYAFVQPELYAVVQQVDVARRDDLVARTEALIDFDDMAQALLIHGDTFPAYVPSLELQDVPRGTFGISSVYRGETRVRLRVHAGGSVDEREVVLPAPSNARPAYVHLEDFGPAERVEVESLTPGARIWAAVRPSTR